MSDTLSWKHFRAVRTEIEGRFFSTDEAEQLVEAIEARTITDPKLRAAAASCWEPPTGEFANGS